MDDTSGAWRTRYEHVLLANERLQQQLEATHAALRRARTLVKYEPSLPNNDVFTKQLVEEKRRLLARVRTLELRLARLDGVRGAPTSARTFRVDRWRLSVKHAGVQTDVHERKEEHGEEVDEAEEAEEARVDTQGVVAGIVHELKGRLAELEVDVTRLRQENELLRRENQEARENTAAVGNVGQTEEVRLHMREKEEQKELEHLLNDRMRQMKILEMQFAHLQAKMKSQAHLYKESLRKVEELTAELFDAKQTLLKQAEWLHAQEDKNLQLSILEKEVHALRSENTKLNEAITVLSDRPLDLLSVQLEKKTIEISMLEDEKTRLERVTEKLEQENKTLQQTNERLRGKIKGQNKEVEDANAELRDLKTKCEQFASEKEIAMLQLQFHLSGEQAEKQEFMKAVGRALREMKMDERGGYLPSTDVPPFHRDAQEQNDKLLSHRLSTDRTRKAAELAQLLQEDYRAQLEDLRVAHQAEVRDLRHKWKRWERKANDYLRELHEIQSAKSNEQIQGYWAPKQKVSTQRPVDVVAVDSKDAAESSKSVLLQVHLHDLRFDFSTRDADGGTPRFLLFCDYFDFESQNSPPFVAPEDGLSYADLDLEIGFTIPVNQAFCQSPLAQAFTIELHQVTFTYADIIGIARVSLQSLFVSEKGEMAMSVKLRHPVSNACVGSVRLSCTLSRPIYALFRASLPKKPVTQPLSTLQLSNVPADMHAKIGIAAAVLLQEVVPAGAKVRLSYRFMGNPSVAYSRTATESAAFGYRYVGFERHRAYDMPTDDAFLGHLQRYELGLSLTTSAGNPHRDEAQGVIPFASIAKLLREGGRDHGFISFATIKRDEAASERVLGRVWVEISVGATSPRLDAADVRECVRRVFGDTSTRINWRRFSLAVSLTPTERVVRQLIQEKCSESALKMLHIKLKSDPFDGTLASILQGSAAKLTRSDLCFVHGALLGSTDCTEVDEPASQTERISEHVRAKLMLLIETMDTEWLRWEASLRRRTLELKLLVEYASEEDWIEWEVVAYRLRLM